MSTTTNLGLNKHDNPSTNTNVFDVENYLNANWDIIDEKLNNNTTRIKNREPLHTYYRYDITEDIAEDTVINLDFEYKDLVVLFCGERLIKDVDYEETSSTSITLLFSISYIEDYNKYIDFIVKSVDEEDNDE